MTKNGFTNLIVTVFLAIGFMVCTLQVAGVPLSDIPMFLGQIFLLATGITGALFIVNKALELVFTR